MKTVSLKATLTIAALCFNLGSSIGSHYADSKVQHAERHNFATCKPSGKGACAACTNCKYCKNCSERGGTCTVCKPPPPPKKG